MSFFFPSLVPSTTFKLSFPYVKQSPSIFSAAELITVFCYSLRLVPRINSQQKLQHTFNVLKWALIYIFSMPYSESLMISRFYI